MSKKLQQISVPLISVFLGILLGAIVMWVFGYDAIWGYEELFYTAFGSLRGIGEIFRAMGPLILIGLGFAVASRAGFFNVGLPGQALVGWIFERLVCSFKSRHATSLDDYLYNSYRLSCWWDCRSDSRSFKSLF